MKKGVMLLFLVLLLAPLSSAQVQDADQDGVPNANDKCPDSATNVVDVIGCTCTQKTQSNCASAYQGAQCCQADNNPCTDDCATDNIGKASCNLADNTNQCQINGVQGYCQNRECRPGNTETVTCSFRRSQSTAITGNVAGLSSVTGNAVEYYDTLIATPASARPGDPVTLSWDANLGSNLVLNPGNINVNGMTSYVVHPVSDTMYSLTVDSQGTKKVYRTFVKVTSVAGRGQSQRTAGLWVGPWYTPRDTPPYIDDAKTVTKLKQDFGGNLIMYSLDWLFFDYWNGNNFRSGNYQSNINKILSFCQARIAEAQASNVELYWQTIIPFEKSNSLTYKRQFLNDIMPCFESGRVRGIHTVDEPTGGPPAGIPKSWDQDSMKEGYDLFKEIYPTKLVWYNELPLGLQGGIQVSDARGWDWGDIVSLDWYIIPNPNVPGNMNLMMQRLKTLAGNRDAWFIHQAVSMNIFRDQPISAREPTPDELRTLAELSWNNGLDGIIWWGMVQNNLISQHNMFASQGSFRNEFVPDENFKATLRSINTGQPQTPNPARNTKFGIFYFGWHCPVDRNPAFDISEAMAGRQQWGPVPAFHYWDEPQNGYYCISTDDNVLRDHATKLRDAGIDFIFFNMAEWTYINSVGGRTTEMVLQPFERLLRVWSTIPNAPRVVPFFRLSSDSDVADEALVILERFPEMRFTYEGKPLALVVEYNADENRITTLSQRYTVRKMWGLQQSGNAWSFIQHCRQGFRESQGNGACSQRVISHNGRPETISVTAGYQETYMSDRITAIPKFNGKTFVKQFQTVFENPDIPIVTISTWNEWIAQRGCKNTQGQDIQDMSQCDESKRFVDLFDIEYSKDIEPAKNEKGDFYYQLMKSCITKYRNGEAYCDTNVQFTPYNPTTCSNTDQSCGTYPNCVNCESQGKTCQNGACVQRQCTPNSQKRCDGNSIYWYDSCNNKGNLFYDCNQNSFRKRCNDAKCCFPGNLFCYTPPQQCQDACNPGEKRCKSDNSGYEECSDNDNNGCYEWVQRPCQNGCTNGNCNNQNVQRNAKFGIFYFLWHCPASQQPIYDISEISAGRQQWGPLWPSFHWWDEPQNGYYCLSNNDNVLRDHANKLKEANIDFVFVDMTNWPTSQPGSNYHPEEMVLRPFNRLIEVWSTIPNAPKIVPWIQLTDNSNIDVPVLAKLQQYPGMQFMYLGKPLLLVVDPPSESRLNILSQSYTVKKMWGLAQSGNSWSFLSPCRQGFRESLGNNQCGQRISSHNGQPESVSVATAYQETYISDKRTAIPKFNGKTFVKQFQTVFDNQNVAIVTITGWNEWIAQRACFGADGVPVPEPVTNDPRCVTSTFPDNSRIFTDAYDIEYNRDIEPAKNEKGDFYYQLMKSCISKYKNGDNSCDTNVQFTPYNPANPCANVPCNNIPAPRCEKEKILRTFFPRKCKKRQRSYTKNNNI